MSRSGMKLAAFLVAAIVLLPLSALSAPEWMTRPGTIGHALQQSDGSRVYLDAVRIDKNKPHQSPSYFTIGECFDRDARIIVAATLPPDFRLGQTIDVEGTLITLSNGHRAIADPTIIAYLDREGRMLYHGPMIKGLLQPTPWQWKQSFAITTGTKNVSTSSEDGDSILSEEPSAPGGEPNPSPLSGSTLVSSLAEAKSQPDGTFIEIQCKPIQSAGTGYFVMAEDGTAETLKVY